MKRSRNALARFFAVSGRLVCLSAMAAFLALPFLHRHEHARQAAAGAPARDPGVHGLDLPAPAVSAAGTGCRADFCGGDRHGFHTDCAVCRVLSYSFLSLCVPVFYCSRPRPEILPAAFPTFPAIFNQRSPRARAPPADPLPA